MSDLDLRDGRLGAVVGRWCYLALVALVSLLATLVRHNTSTVAQEPRTNHLRESFQTFLQVGTFYAMRHCQRSARNLPPLHNSRFQRLRDGRYYNGWRSFFSILKAAGVFGQHDGSYHTLFDNAF